MGQLLTVTDVSTACVVVIFDCEDNYLTGCQNVSRCQQLSHSGLCSPRWSCSTYSCTINIGWPFYYPLPTHPPTSSLPLILTLFIALSSLPFSAKKKGLHYSLPVLRLWKNYSSQNNVANVFHWILKIMNYHFFVSLAKITRCGHIYCWSCILHYLSLVSAYSTSLYIMCICNL